MASLRRKRNGKRFSSKEIGEGGLITGCSTGQSFPEGRVIIRIASTGNTDDCDEWYSLEMTGGECEELVRLLNERIAWIAKQRAELPDSPSV